MIQTKTETVQQILVALPSNTLHKNSFSGSQVTSWIQTTILHNFNRYCAKSHSLLYIIKWKCIYNSALPELCIKTPAQNDKQIKAGSPLINNFNNSQSCIILVNNQLDTLFKCIYLFHFSTCFEQPSAHHQQNQLYQYIIWYISHYVGDCLVWRSFRTGIPGSHLHSVIYTRWCIDTIDSPDDEHWVARNM